MLVPTSDEYARYLGGSSTFSGIVIGIPTVGAGLALWPMVRYDKGNYKMALHVACATNILGSIFYAMAYRLDFLYLILIGRIVSGVGQTGSMYAKRYCSDSRIVGVRQRTTLASWLVITQGLGISAGPFLGGLGYQVGFSNEICESSVF